MGRSLICISNLMREDEILSALKRGARSTSDIQRITRAGKSCGRCLVIIDSLVEDYLAQLPNDPQKRIDFEI